MRRLLLLGICLLPVVLFGSASDAMASANQGEGGNRFTFTARLAGANEVPAKTNSDLRGRAQITINLSKNVLCWDLEYSTATQQVTAAHIHVGDAGANGPVKFGFFNPPPSNPPFPNEGCRSADPALLQAIAANPGHYYVNIHTTLYPGGAARGQLKTEDNDESGDD